MLVFGSCCEFVLVPEYVVDFSACFFFRLGYNVENVFFVWVSDDE